MNSVSQIVVHCKFDSHLVGRSQLTTHVLHIVNKGFVRKVRDHLGYTTLTEGYDTHENCVRDL